MGNRGPDSPEFARRTFRRLEGELLPADAAWQAAFFARNAQGLRERMLRCAGVGIAAPFAPLMRPARPAAWLRFLHAWTRGLSRDRLDFLGEEYFQRVLRPRLDAAKPAGPGVVLLSSWLEHVVRPIARHLGVKHVLCNRLEFRGGRATGRIADPVVTPPRGDPAPALLAAIRPTDPEPVYEPRPTVVYDPSARLADGLSVREALKDRSILLIGATGFIGKVWLANLLHDLPELGRIYLLVRPRGPRSGQERFDRVVQESPVLRAVDPERIRTKVEVVEGDMCADDLGLAPDVAARLRPEIDVIVNSGGITEFNPDLRSALATNIDATIKVLAFQRSCDHAALLHLSTCYVAGHRNGRVPETIRRDYTPNPWPAFDAEKERQELHQIVADAEKVAEQGDVVLPMRRGGKVMSDAQLRKAKTRWLRRHLAEVGQARALRYGWPNTYTFTKSLAESQIEGRAPDLPIAVVRPSIVETSTARPFPGWNEGVNTSAPLAHLLGTLFRQLPTNERKRLDVVPVDLVTRGMTLIAAALVKRCHARCYQIATSASNPCDMRRSIELTALAHRKHYRERPGFDAWMKSRMETIPVSRRRYRVLSAPSQKAVVRALRRVLPLRKLERMERNLDRVEKLIELYEPYIHDDDHVFEADRIGLLDAALPPDERELFGYDAGTIDWAEYWIDIHVPALRRWAYPLLEGRPIEA